MKFLAYSSIYAILDLPNGDLHVGTHGYLEDVPSTLDCCKACDRNRKCFNWSYGLVGEHKGRCFLKQKEGGYSEDRAHFISGSASVRAGSKHRYDEL
jgi:hypothetical protein